MLRRSSLGLDTAVVDEFGEKMDPSAGGGFRSVFRSDALSVEGSEDVEREGLTSSFWGTGAPMVVGGTVLTMVTGHKMLPCSRANTAL